MGKKNKNHTNPTKVHKINDQIRQHKKNKKRNKNKIKNLKKLLDNLQNLSNQNLDSTCDDNTVIIIDDTISESTINLPDTNIMEHNENPLVILDEGIVNKTPRKNLNTAPKDCSTPLAKSINNVPLNNNIDETENFNSDINNLTKEINRDSYLTIDLTTDSNISKTNCNTVIDLDNSNDNHDCTFVPMRNSNLSISGESNVTVVNGFVNQISKLNTQEKEKLFTLITENIFNGCNISNVKGHVERRTETAENTYIKEVILGQKKSRNSIGSNIYNPEKEEGKKSGLRMIVIDGSNVAMEHGKGRVFSVKGLKICIDYFLKRGHVVKAFVPRFRCKFGKSSDPRLLDGLERRGLVVYTPSREIQGRMVTSYDDRYIVQCAAEFDGVIVSGDNYRDLHRENPRWRFVIENRVLPFTWVNDMIMFPRDPLGRNGPSLEVFLKHTPESKMCATEIIS